MATPGMARVPPGGYDDHRSVASRSSLPRVSLGVDVSEKRAHGATVGRGLFHHREVGRVGYDELAHVRDSLDEGLLTLQGGLIELARYHQSRCVDGVEPLDDG